MMDLEIPVFASRVKHIALMAAACLALFVAPFIRAADDASLEKLQPALRADLSSEGLITWWLVSPPLAKFPAPRQVPLNAREALPTNASAGWTLDIAENFYNNFQSHLKDGARGPLYASARIHSITGGQRIVYLKTYCEIKIYIDGKLVLNKPKPERMADFSAPVVIPKGACELTLELTPRGDQCMVQCLLLDPNMAGGRARPVVGDSLAYPLAGAAEPNSSEAAAQKYFTKSVSLTPKEGFVKPGDKTEITAVNAGSSAKGVGTVTARIAGDKPLPFPKGDRVVLSVQLPTEIRNAYDVNVEFLVDGKVIGNKTVSLLCLEGFLKETAALERDIKDRTAKTGKQFPNARLALEKLNLFVESEQAGGDPRAPASAQEMKELAENARKFMALEEQGADPFANDVGYSERGYVSSIDGQVQPYIVSAHKSSPDSMKGEKAPLVIFLHGYDPSINKHRWWEAKDFAAVCARHGCYMAIPFGRSNTDFQSCGEVDVLDVVAEMRKAYNIDPDRIYLYGYSMGGMAVYTIAAHHPDLFAGGIVLAGRADNPLQNYTAMENFHPYKQALMHADNPISLCENLVNFPLRIYHGNDDPVVPKSQALRMNARFKALGADAALILKDGGHTFGFDVLQEDEPLEWLLSKRRVKAPAKRSMKSYSLAFAKQGGVEVSSISSGIDPIEITWTETDGKKSVIKESANIARKSIDGVPPPETDFKTKKIPALCGPVRQVICTPFMIVYGTKGTVAANKLNKENAEKFALWWFDFTRSKIETKADVEVTADEKLTRNLFLFGEEQDNALHAEAAKSLPITVKNGTVKIGEKSTPLAGKGIIYLHPSPFAQKEPHAVVICAGIQFGEKIGANHKLDLIPDFLLYGPDFDADGTSTNRTLCAGFFDGSWKLNEKTTWWFDK